MKRSLLSRLRSNGISYLISGLILVLVVPFYQIFVLGPTGFSNALAETGAGRYTAYLTWISTHISQFLIYRSLLLIAFLLLLTFPFTLYQIIVAQEIMGQQEREAEAQASNTAIMDEDNTTNEEENSTTPSQEISMPEYAWRGKGFAVLAAWLSLIGLCIYLIGEAGSTAYYLLIATSTGTALQNSVTTYSPMLILVTDTAGTGLIGLGSLFFGAMILRTGRNLWPDSWVAFSYMALFTGAILCISGVAVASAPGSGQSTLTTIATLLFAVEIIWTGIMLIRLTPEV